MPWSLLSDKWEGKPHGAVAAFPTTARVGTFSGADPPPRRRGQVHIHLERFPAERAQSRASAAATPTEKGRRDARRACIRARACVSRHGRVGRPGHGRAGVGSTPAAPRCPPAAAWAGPTTALQSPRIPDPAAGPARPLRAPPGSTDGTDLPATRPSAVPPRSQPRP